MRSAHVGLNVRDIDCMERFYAGFLGLVVTGRGDEWAMRDELGILTQMGQIVIER